MARPKWEPQESDFKLMETLGGVLKQDQLAEYYGVSARTLQQRFKDHPEFRDAYDKGRANTIAKVAQSLVDKALKGNLTAQIFYLKTQAGWWDKQIMEHSGPNGGAIGVEVTDEARRDVLGSLARLADRIATQRGAEGIGAVGGGPRTDLPAPEVGVDVLGEAGSVPSSDAEVVPLADVVGPGSGEDEDGG